MKLRILFMGTPEFSLFSLRALCDSDDEIVGVVTQTDKPQGRGYVLTPSPVKVFANERNIPVYQPKTLRDEEFALLLKKIDPDMIVVVAFGKILPQNVIDYPKYGCINVHGSYLPKYRGAAPMQRAIIDGESKTGVTIMYMDAGLDTGAMIARKHITIEENDNFENIHDKIGKTGAELLLKTIKQLKEGEVKTVKQYGAYSTYAAKIDKSECYVNFDMPAKQVHDLIRGLSPFPLALTHSGDGRIIKIVTARISEVKKETEHHAGEVVSLDNGAITVACADGCIDLTEIVPEGKRRMSAADYIRGRSVSLHEIFKP